MISVLKRPLWFRASEDECAFSWRRSSNEQLKYSVAAGQPLGIWLRNGWNESFPETAADPWNAAAPYQKTTLGLALLILLFPINAQAEDPNPPNGLTGIFGQDLALPHTAGSSRAGNTRVRPPWRGRIEGAAAEKRCGILHLRYRTHSRNPDKERNVHDETPSNCPGTPSACVGFDSSTGSTANLTDMGA